VILAVLVTLSMTLPHLAADSACGTSADPVALESMFVWTQEPVMETLPHRAWASRVAGLEGQPYTVTVDIPEGGIAWATTTTADGAESCPSNVALPPVLAVPLVSHPKPSAWFDLQGRRVVGPPAPGIYFRPRQRRTALR
jgi:hypothetical protein